MVGEKNMRRQKAKAVESSSIEEDIAKYLANGGKITICPPGATTENIDVKRFYGRKKSKSDTKK
jgi:predicted peroxiredoxin